MSTSTNKNVDGVIMPMSEAEIAKKNAEEIASNTRDDTECVKVFRKHRNELLVGTDYYGLPDQTMTPEMTTYRQALRDAPDGIETAEQALNFVWPVNPEG